MAVKALGNLPVRTVAGRTTNLAVLARSALPFLIDLAVTAVTGSQLDIVAQGNL